MTSARDARTQWELLIDQRSSDQRLDLGRAGVKFAKLRGCGKGRAQLRLMEKKRELVRRALLSEQD
jgi:hypothetical protein